VLNIVMTWFRNHRAQLRLGLRITVAGLLTYALCPVLGVTQSYQAVLTTVIVMQASVGASLKAVMERFIGSLGGALWAGGVLLVLQHFNRFSAGKALVIGLVPLAMLAAFKSEYRAAPVTAIILLLTPGSVAPLASATQRMMGIGLGSVVALIVSLVILPARAHGSFAEAASSAVSGLAVLAAVLMKGFTESKDPDFILKLHDELRQAIGRVESFANEVARERAAHVAYAPDPLPMCRVLRRIRNDLTMIGRTTAEPLPVLIPSAFSEVTAATGSAVAAFLEDSSNAIKRQQHAPSLERSEMEMARFASTLTEMRRNVLLRDLPDETVGRIFGLAFSIEQLHQNLKDLADRINDLARNPPS
jgi:uncharacterized membrane protein YccC